MVIRTFDTVYSIIHAGKTEGMMPVYLCRNESDNELYQLFRMEKSCLREDTVAFLNEQLQNRDFNDFKDMFLYEDKFYVAMRYALAPSLQDRLTESMELEERLEIGKRVLEMFMLTRMPAYFRCKCLAPDRLLLTDSLDIQFSYTLDDIEMASAMKMQDCWNAFAKLLETLWKVELKNHTVPEIKDFMDFLYFDKNKTEEQVYRQYLIMKETFLQVEKEERKKPRKFLFELWDKLKLGIPFVKKLAALLILLAVIGYLVYTVWLEKQPSGGRQQQIQYIGTLNVEE